MRCHQVKHLIVLGADEGSMPGYGGSKGLLTDQERVRLRKLGIPLTGGAMEGLQAEFADIYGVFCGAENSISVICSDQQPCFIYRRLVSIAGGEKQIPALSAAALRSRRAAGATLAAWEAEGAAGALGLEADYAHTQRCKHYHLGAIQRENIPKLYGKKLNLSASQIDRQAQCRLSYFLQYGLRAKERKEATVDPAEFGTYVHAVLEKTVRDVMERGGFHQVDLETTMAIAMEHSAQYADERFSQLDSQRVEYLFRRNMLEMEMVVRELWQELSQASYTPAHVELSFGMGGQMEAIDIHGSTMDARLRGLVDRVDT
jgi:ATP-dependent helicase/nuclease subunit B